MAKKEKTAESKHNPNRQEMMTKNFHFNRYLMLRYAIALFFFTNLYWFIILLLGGGWGWLLPKILMLFTIPATYEQWKLYGDLSKKIDKQLEFNRYFYSVQTIVNFVLIIVALQGGALYQDLFPFLTTPIETRLVLSGILTFGIMLSTFCLKRIQKVKENKDKFYSRIREFEYKKS